MEIEETKEKIIKAATELFLKDGCKRVTMDFIATSMHISKRTLYEIFANKKELLKACINTIHDEVEVNRNHLNSQVDEPILLALYLMHNTAVTNHKYDTFQEDIQRYYPEIYEYFSQKHTRLFHQELSKALEEAQLKGILRPNVDLNQVFNTIATYMHSCRSESSKTQKDEWLLNVRETLYTYMRGLMTTDAILRYDTQKERFQQLFNKNEINNHIE